MTPGEVHKITEQNRKCTSEQRLSKLRAEPRSAELLVWEYGVLVWPSQVRLLGGCLVLSLLVYSRLCGSTMLVLGRGGGRYRSHSFLSVAIPLRFNCGVGVKLFDV